MRHPARSDARSGRLRRAEGRLWTGPAAHLLGGALDLAEALLRWLAARLRGRQVR